LLHQKNVMMQFRFGCVLLAQLVFSGLVSAQVALNHVVLAQFETELSDVIELIGGEQVKVKLAEVEAAYLEDSSVGNRLRLGLIYHEVALNLTFLDPTDAYAGYALKCVDMLKALAADSNTRPEAMVFIESYLASALSLMAAETKKLKLLGEAFDLFDIAVQRYSHASPRPEFMRGSVAENLPWIMWRKRKYARIDFTSIIAKQEAQPGYADFRVMSFSYWAWAKAHSSRKHRAKALQYLNRAIALDPHYKAGRQRAEDLKASWE